jgi:hypothetical protein
MIIVIFNCKETKMSEYKCKEGMIDNRKVTDSHQEGIKRVLQRGRSKPDVEGHFGKLGKHSKAHFSRKGEGLTPRKA